MGLVPSSLKMLKSNFFFFFLILFFSLLLPQPTPLHTWLAKRILTRPSPPQRLPVSLLISVLNPSEECTYQNVVKHFRDKIPSAGCREQENAAESSSKKRRAERGGGRGSRGKLSITREE